METLRYVLLANGSLAVVSIAYYVLLRRETFFDANRLALWLGLAAAVVLPLLELPDWRPQPVRKVMQRTAQVILPKVLPKSSEPDVTLTVPNDQTYRTFPAQPTAFIWSWQMGLIILYWAGVVALLVRFGVQLVSLRRLIRGSERDEYDDFTLLRNDRITSPFSFFGWVVLNPDHHTTEELEQILRHERVHVRAWHSLDMIGAELVCIVFWFNPAAYLFRYLIHQTLEFSADRAVLAEGIDAKAYQYNLVKVSLSGQKSRLVNTFSGPTLRHRIGMMNRRLSNRRAWVRYFSLFAGVLATTLSCHWSEQIQHRYVQSKGEVLYGLITSRTTQTDLNTLKQVLTKRNIALSIDSLMKLSDGRISQIALTLNVRKPGHPISTTVGSLANHSAIPAIGLHCDETGCRVGAIDETFPERLKILAQRESPLSLMSETLYANELDQIKGENSKFGMYRLYFRNDFLESNYFGTRGTGVRMTPDYHLEPYPEYKKAVIFIDGKEANLSELSAFLAIDLKKVVVFDGKAAIHRLGDQRARHGLILVYRLPKIDIRDKYAATPLLEQVYPELFTRRIGHVSVH